MMRKIKKFFKFLIIMFIICGAGYLIYNNTDLFVVRYTISFDSGGADIEQEKIRVDKDGTVTLPELTKEGYNFEGWYSQGTKWTNDMPVTDDLNLVARWSAIKYNITFVVDGVQTVKKVDYETIPSYGSTPTKSSPINHIEYTFVRWEPEIKEVTKDTTYTAIFSENIKKNTITLTSNIDQAGELTGSGEYLHKSDATISTTVNSGYRFLGWYDSCDNLYSNMPSLTISSIDTDLDLTAKFELITYTIKFVVDGNTTEIEVKEGELPVYKGTPNKTSTDPYISYEFSAWSPTITNANSDATYTAVFNQVVAQHTVQINITPHMDAGTVTGAGKYNHYTDATLTATPNTGYEFVGWFNARNNAPYANTPTIIFKVTTDQSFIAGFKAIDYTITYNLNNGSLSDTNPTKYNIDTMGFTLNNPTKTGYTFSGWTGSGYSNPTKSVFIPMGTTGNLTFTANWTPITYTITYDLDGGYLTNSNPSSYTIETATFTLNHPVKDGYVFIGWTGTGYSTPTIDITITLGSIGNLEFTANYSNNSPVTLTIKTTNGITLDTITQLPNTPLYQPDINEFGMTGYQLLGYYTNSDCTQAFDFSVMPNSHQTIYAKFGDYFLDQGFIPYLDEFDYYISNNKPADINSFNELVAFIDYCNFNYIATDTYFTATYTTLTNSEISKALTECSFPLVYNVYGAGTSSGVTYGVIALDGEWKDNEALITADTNKNYTYTQINSAFKSSNTSSRLSTNTSFNINKVSQTLEVETSNQLVYALEKGYRPICISGSPAESVYNKAKTVLNQICDDTMTDVEKAKAIYDWLIYNVDYDNRVLTLTADNNTEPYWPSYDAFYAEGVFNNGVAVCDGIAKALLIMCKIENIPTVRTKGNGHGWNKIYINNTWYGIDATHGDLSDSNNHTSKHTYSAFLFTDSCKTSMGYTDVLNDEEISCTSVYNYYDLASYTYSYYDNNQQKLVTEEFDLQIDNVEELTILFKYIESLNLSHTTPYSIEFTYASSDIQSLINTAASDADVSWIRYSLSYIMTTTGLYSYILIPSYS